MHNSGKKIAIIGMGATSLYLLKNLLERVDVLRSAIDGIVVYERGSRVGMGMPYNPTTTDRYNICNISSEEIPELHQPFADWLRDQSDTSLAQFDLQRERISESETYARLALGEYFEAQFTAVVDQLKSKGIDVDVRLNTEVADLQDDPDAGVVTLVTDHSRDTFARVVIATGHAFDEPDEPANGYFASPWPIGKLIPKEGTFHNFAIGTLGASLSAFDVITSLAHRHGRFEEHGDHLRFVPDPRADQFRLSMHSSNGWLPHLQYDQRRPFREVYRYISREKLLSMRDGEGRLRLQQYFDEVCRPALAAAFRKDARQDVAQKLLDEKYTLEEFVDEMTAEHEYADAFEGMRKEYPQSKRSVRENQPIHWKETLDDLMYTLSYHAELMPAEDHVRFRKTVMSFLMNVIAAMPLRSAQILLALHDAGLLELIAGHASVAKKEDGHTVVRVEDEGKKDEYTYGMYINCAGQPPITLDPFPFPSLAAAGSIRQARVAFIVPPNSSADGDGKSSDLIQTPAGPAMKLDGIDIDAAYRVIGADGKANPRLFDVAFPHTIGLRPYSYGLQACNHTAGIVVEAWRVEAETGSQPASSTATLTKLHDQVANEA